MVSQSDSLIECTLTAAALYLVGDTVVGIIIDVERLVRTFFEVLIVEYHLLTDEVVVFFSHLAAGVTAGVSKKLYSSSVLRWYLFQKVEPVVEVVIENNDAVILFQLTYRAFDIIKALAGRAGQLVVCR